MIGSAEEFVRLREMNDERANTDEAPGQVWAEIIDRYPEMKEWVLHNKTVPVAVLRRLAQDPDSNVRYAVAVKRKCPPDLMELLANDPDESVRYGLVFNANAPATVLRALTRDPSQRVADMAIARLASSGAPG